MDKTQRPPHKDFYGWEKIDEDVYLSRPFSPELPIGKRLNLRQGVMVIESSSIVLYANEAYNICEGEDDYLTELKEDLECCN